MSEFRFEFSESPTRSSSPASSLSTQLGDADPKPTDIRACDSQILVFDSPILKVCVGTDPDTAGFFVHETLFTSRSGFFRCAISQAFRGTEAHVVALPDDDPDTFRLYLNLIYTHQLVTRGTDQWLKLCRLYVLAEKLQDVTSKNHIIDGMYAFFSDIACQPTLSINVQRILPAAATTELYEGTSNQSQARELVLDLYADSGNISWLLSEQAKLPTEFICDVAVRLLQRRGYVFSGFRIRRPSYGYHEVNVSSPGMTRAVTGEVDASANGLNDAAMAIAVAKKESYENIQELGNAAKESTLEDHDAAVVDVATPATEHTLPPLKGVVTEVRWELDRW
ncbi:hypothetical protein J4E91_001477 [Alternaria rosae]|nr:hypothetical protein J4E91_001477 [Alternaria rosae]